MLFLVFFSGHFLCRRSHDDPPHEMPWSGHVTWLPRPFHTDPRTNMPSCGGRDTHRSYGKRGKTTTTTMMMMMMLVRMLTITYTDADLDS